LAGMKIEQRDSTGAVLGSAYTDSTGSFNFQGKRDATITNGVVLVVGGTSGCNVRLTSGGTMPGVTIGTGLNFGSDVILGTNFLNEAKDPLGTGRAPINVAVTVQSVIDWAKSRSS